MQQSYLNSNSNVDVNVKISNSILSDSNIRNRFNSLNNHIRNKKIFNTKVVDSPKIFFLIQTYGYSASTISNIRLNFKRLNFYPVQFKSSLLRQLHINNFCLPLSLFNYVNNTSFLIFSLDINLLNSKTQYSLLTNLNNLMSLLALKDYALLINYYNKWVISNSSDMKNILQNYSSLNIFLPTVPIYRLFSNFSILFTSQFIIFFKIINWKINHFTVL